MKNKKTDLGPLQTFEIACSFLEIDPVLPGIVGIEEKQGKAIVAVHKLSIISAAAWKVAGDTLDWDNSNQIKREMVFKMSSSGLGFSCHGCGIWGSGSFVGSRLVFPDNVEILDFVSENHLDLFRDWMCK